MPDTPLTCRWCQNSPATQAFVMDWPLIGRRTSLVCDPCGDRGDPDARSVGAMVWRFRLTPIKEKTDA